MKKLISILTLGSIAISLSAQSLKFGPPVPPVGKRWVLNEDFSDEFNGTELDNEKWFDYHPKWIGREPGIFLPSQVAVKDGFLQITGKKLEKDTIVTSKWNKKKKYTFNIAGGAVVSKKSTKFGYYETRMKASKTTLSATFWFSTPKHYEGPNGCDKYHLEWDIQECIGKTGDFQGKFFSNGMNSNGHYWYTPCDEKQKDLKAADVKFGNAEVASKNFHVYGGWWKDEKSSSLYYDNNPPKELKFYDKVSGTPFDQPMRMRLVVETYPFPWIPLPTDEDLADPANATVMYDWVRAYKLVDLNDTSINQTHESSLKLYDESIAFADSDMTIEKKKFKGKLSIPISYKSNVERTVYVRILDPRDQLTSKSKWDKKLADQIIKVQPGHGAIEFDFKLKKGDLKDTNLLKVEALIRDHESSNYKNNCIDRSDLFINLK